tara:strand:+ start:218 stop:1231 length:1014 start_codon:yes stop_codon:yes gene_type:complete
LSENYNILVTGGAGFIGSALCRNIITNTNNKLIILDKLTYASNLKSLKSIIKNENVFFFKGSISNKKIVENILESFCPRHVFNFAAETHVDNSISNPKSFIKTNILDTHQFLELILKYYKKLNDNEAKLFKFIQISTDEVYGDINLNQEPVKENTAYNPSSPYSASKAAGDHLVKAYYRTFGFPGLISNCSNNFGPFQNGEKFIPTIIKNLLNKKKIPVYGNGKQIREWIYVDDHCDALLKLIELGQPGENYNIGNGNEINNLELIKKILTILKNISLIDNLDIQNHIDFIEDRLGHDRRYAIDSSKIKQLCNWKADTDFELGLQKTISSILSPNQI